jgi:hypothetical protein
MGPLYKDYGIYIIRHYPWQFARYYLWPNTNKYYAPPVEFLDSYNSGRYSVTKQAKEWFGYKDIKVKTRFKKNETWVLDFYPILSGVINIIMLITLVYYYTLKGWRHQPKFLKIVLLVGTIWLLNAGFTILASSPALRFQSFPILLTVMSTFLLVDWLWTIAIKPKPNNIIHHNSNTLEEKLSVYH